MANKGSEDPRLWIVTPFEKPDIGLAIAAAKAGAFSVVHLGQDQEVAQEALNEMLSRVTTFGVCVTERTEWDITLPNSVEKIIVPWGMHVSASAKAEIVWQVHSVEEAEQAISAQGKTLILKGAEGAGRCGEDSTFILFQKLIGICQSAGVAVFVQGGIGTHAAAAYMALGAAGVVFDSQVALFPECGLTQPRKTALGKLSGAEIRICEGYRYYRYPVSVEGSGRRVTEEITDLDTLYTHISEENSDLVPLGQDVLLATDLVDEYKRLKHLVRAINQSVFMHVLQAQNKDSFAQGGTTAASLGIDYPIAQGPMARISDVPAFLREVADGGALPFFAMSMMTGDAAVSALKDTAEAMGGKPWGVGILGFTYPKTLEEQTQIILETHPPYVLIAGGRPAQEKPFAQAGIKVLLHAPSPSSLDLFLNDGSRNFIFEGRESGGHVGPLYSVVLWEKQINRILKKENQSDICAFFAGGIHDALSAAFVRIMTGPLAVRDVKVALLCGTAYLYTEEAVTRGAISEAYQRILVEKKQTLLLKSGSGQETRCVQSPFTDYFLAEKKRMEEEGLETGAIVLKLEALNLGRLRIASKGVERVDKDLITLSVEEQTEKGLYMTGTVTEMIDQTTTIAGLHRILINDSLSVLSAIEVAEPSRSAKVANDVAVVGMAGLFPGAEDLEEFWRNIVFARDCVTEVPEDRWSKELFYDPDTKDTDHTVSKWGAFIDAVDFDALEFGITPQSLSAIETSQLLSLLLAKRALQDAGYTDLSQVDLDETSVVFGGQGGGELATNYGARSGFIKYLGELPQEAAEILPTLTEDSFAGVLGNVISGRISNRLNTGGRNFTIDAACASSLAALDVAINQLYSDRADMVILGGADLQNSVNSYLMFSSTYALSKKGRCATFDSEADGIVLGEGIGVVILKRLADAERDGNKIYAVIKGIGGTSDGKSLGLTAPSKRGQVRTLTQAYERAGVRPSEVGLIESHGTGTVVGDRIELRALTDVFLDDGTPPHRTALGSIKSQIGHTKCAAGVAGLIKLVHCVRHGVLPATLNLNKPNEVYSENSPFAFRTEKAGYWREDRRIAGVSGFGFGGTNFHAIIENYEPSNKRPEALLKAWPSELFAFPGETREDALLLMSKVKELLILNNKIRLKNVAFSLAQKCGDNPIQYVIVTGTRDKLLTSLDEILAGSEDIIDQENVFRLNPVPGKVAFLFSGQGSQRVNMAAELFLVFPQMRRLLNELPAYEDILFPRAVFSAADKKTQRDTIIDTRNAQPLLGIVDLAIAELLRSFGIEPDMTAGHSYGEIPALCFAGAFDSADLAALSRARAEAILDAVGEDPGRMAAVMTDAETLGGLLEDEQDVWAVNYNTPRQTVVAGTTAGMEAFLKKAAEAKVACNELKVACAFHSPLLQGSDKTFTEALKGTSFRGTALPVWSNTDAGVYPETGKMIKERLAAHLVNPVLFTEEIRRMSDDGATVFIEAGPGGTLTKMAADILKDREIAVVQTERSGAEGLTVFLQALAKYITTGRMINMERLFDGREATQLNIDEPSQHKKPGIVWKVNGQVALPENGELPAHAGNPLAGPVSLGAMAGRLNISGVNVEQIMMSYLDNMNAVIQDQRDVMLSYFGTPDIQPRMGAVRRQVVVTNVPEGEALPALAAPEESAEEEVVNNLPDIISLSSEEITNIVFEIVSEKTGYPVDMLAPEMDLEADLSIDSIKKMEIVGGLRDRINLPEVEGNMDVFFEKMISIKKFVDLTSWIEELGQAVASGVTFDDVGGGFEGGQLVADVSSQSLETTTVLPLSDPSGDMEIVRMVLVETSDPIGEKDVAVLAGKTFAIAGDGTGLDDRVAEKLRDLGGNAVQVTFGNGKPTVVKSEAAATSGQEGQEVSLSDCDGVVMINSAAAGAKRYSVVDLFNLLKQADVHRIQWVLVFDDVPGAILGAGELEKTDQGQVELPGGFSGFTKTMLHEYTGKRYATVQFETPFDPESFAGIVVDELAAVEPVPEVFYRGAERFVMLPRVGERIARNRADENEGSDVTPRTVLNEESVVVVLGGAQGITPYVLESMALEVPCQYVLLGRSPADLENEHYGELGSVEDIRKYLIEHEGMRKPKEVETKARRVYKSCQIATAIKRIEGAGGKAAYISVDVTDPKAFAAVLTQIKADYGKINGVVHAAGILEDKLFRDKKEASFARVYNTKTLPLKTILGQLLPDLDMLILFSSMAASFGSAGQCDYAAGNSVFDTTARILKQQNPHLRVTAFDWGPWKGAGMVNDSLEAEFLKKGIALIDVKEGGDFVMDELMCQDEASVLAISGDKNVLSEFLKSMFFVPLNG
ncbi:MAG: SDR family NAD(P)-dependent oxidoreductase [Peptococcaceae bacterium]|nr:SDR family NAD(P)-dependent oxidoreductase [Peptococcaceae bacterium]